MAKKKSKKQKGNIRSNPGSAQAGLNLDSSVSQVGPGKVTYALNAAVENFDDNSVSYQNELGNELCLTFPNGYKLIGEYYIPEKQKHIFFLVNPISEQSEIGFMDNNDCNYQTLINAPCLNFDIKHPIPKVVHRITNCTTEIYWTDGVNPRRYLDIENIPYKLVAGTPSCDPVYGSEVDCNQLKIQPNFSIPQLDIVRVSSVGDLVAGTYQFAIQYSDSGGNELTSYYSVTNPTPIADEFITSINFNYNVGKSIVVGVSNLDITGQFQYFNLAVIKTINNISSVELIGTYNIEESSKEITYTGADKTAIKLSTLDIFEKYPYYDIANDVTAVQDVIVWNNLTSIDRTNYQSIASQITFEWETYRIPPDENYSDELNATNLRGYMRDEVYAFEIVFLLKNGKQTDGFHIPGRIKNNNENKPDVPDTNNDFIGEPDYQEDNIGYSPWWKIYNTGSVIGPSISQSPNSDYKGPWEYGELAYWESLEEYPCNDDVWGDLAGQKIRHHKFPDVLVSPIIENGEIKYGPNNDPSNPSPPCLRFNILNTDLFGNDFNYRYINCEGQELEGTVPTNGQPDNVCAQEGSIFRVSGTSSVIITQIPDYDCTSSGVPTQSDQVILPELRNDAVFPIGIRINNSQIDSLISSSSLTDDQKDDVVGYKIVRGDRGTNKSIVAKGMLRNVNKYTRDEEDYYYPNYPYNDLKEDPFILANNNAFSAESKPWLIYYPDITISNEDSIYEYTSIINGKVSQGNIQKGEVIEICSITKPTSVIGKLVIGPGDYDVWYCYTDHTEVSCGHKIEWEDPFTDWNDLPGGDGTITRDHWLDDNGVGGISDSVTVITEVGVDNKPITTDCGTFAGADCCRPRKRLQPIEDFEPGIVDTPPGVKAGYDENDRRKKSRRSTLNCSENNPQVPINEQEDIAQRQIFNSPETSFGQPFLGDVLKLESVMFGAGKAHFVEVKDNAKYKLLSKEAQQDALESSEAVAGLTSEFNAGAMFTVYQAYLTIYVNGITRKNYGMSFNSRASYDYSFDIDNNVEITPEEIGIKQRDIDFSRYLIPGVQSLGTNELDINNWNRESSVFIKTKDKDETVSPLPLPSNTPSINPTGTSPDISDNSRFTIGNAQTCNAPEKEKDISVVSYYASMKNIVLNQWGQIYSYQTIDTGYQALKKSSESTIATNIVFGGDTFISKFAYKTKLPFFIDNRVNAPDDSDIFYDEIGNIGYPKYWHSARSILEDYKVTEDGDEVSMRNIISYKAHNFDCPNDPASVPKGGGSARTFYDGYMYNFAYGVPSFYCESTYNTDLRQAFNNKEGDFWPHVSSGIPDDWVQESNVPIAQDNTYYYNVTFSKQNKENVFTHLPPDWSLDFCFTNYPFRAIYSDAATINADNRVNNWLVYRALSFHDFPQNYGNLISLDGIQNKAILARFENKSLLYNNLLTIDTSNPQAAYIGNPNLFDSAPPIDFAETDLGYVGAQNKFLLKIPQGQVTIDAKRGQVFLITSKANDLTGFKSGVNKFMKDELPFHILRYFPTVETDNHYNGIGLHGVYDSKFERIIITKLDYAPLLNTIKYDEDENYFYITGKSTDIRTIVSLKDEKYFCNKSWTMSFDFNIFSWISFHSYVPNFYIADNSFFYSGKNGCCEIDKGVPNFEVIAGEVQPVKNITTTSTSTRPPLFTTTTTSTLAPDCNLSGGTFVQTNCALAGVAIITVPPVTTTTICSRPSNLPSVGLLEGYEEPGNPPVISTGSSDDSCSAASIIYLGTPTPPVGTLPIVRNAMYQSISGDLTIGAIIYDGIDASCTLVPNGWYASQQTYLNDIVFRVNSGVVVETRICSETTTTTTTLAATTTTTTTYSATCEEYEIVGPRALSYINCVGNSVPLSVPSGQTVYVCASQSIPGATLITPSNCQII